MRIFFILSVVLLLMHTVTYSQDIIPIPDNPIGKPLTAKLEDFLINNKFCASYPNGMSVSCKTSKVKGSIYSQYCTIQFKDDLDPAYWSADTQITILSDDTIVFTSSTVLENNVIQWTRYWSVLDIKNKKSYLIYEQIQNEHKGVWNTVKSKSPPKVRLIWDVCI